MARIVVVDYGMGNLRSVGKALERVGADVAVSDDPRQAAGARGLVLPGVGAFAAAMTNLTATGWVEPIREHLAADRPFLGICLGLHLLFEESEEFGPTAGLGVLAGRVLAFPDPDPDQPPELVAKVPHMGWNQLRVVADTPLMRGIPDGSWAYFNHSFYVAPADPALTTVRASHGLDFTAAIGRGSLMACQFHPEKSQAVGLRMLANFEECCR